LHPKSGGPPIESARFKLHELVARVLSGIEFASVTLRQGLPQEAIVAYAKEFGIDPIVLGCRRRSTMKRIYVSSSTSAVISPVPCPVLVVPLNFKQQPA